MTRAIVLVVIISGMIWLPTFGQAQSPRRVEVGFTDTAPTIDGIVTLGEWDAASDQGDWSLLRQSESDRSSHQDRFRCLWDATALYVLYRSDYTDWSPNPEGNPAEEALVALKTDLRFGLDNINLYLDPNTDDEPQVRGAHDVDGYQIAWANYLGESYLRGGRFRNTEFYLEAHVNGPFNNRGGWRPPGLATSEIAQNLGAGGGVVEMALHWSDLNAADPSTVEFVERDESLWHPFAPLVDATWIFNLSRITSEAANLLPIWSWHGSNFFAHAPHGELVFRGPHRDGLIARYDLNEASGNVVHDESGVGPSGSLGGTFQLGTPPLASGSSLRLDPAGSVRFAARRLANQNFSVSFWLQPEDPLENGLIVAQGATTGSRSAFELKLTSAGAIELLSDGRALGRSQEGGIAIQAPNHLALMVQSKPGSITIFLYVNGEREIALFGADPWPLKRGPILSFGEFQGRAGFGGQLDEIQIYSRVLSPSEVHHLFQVGGSPLASVPPPHEVPIALEANVLSLGAFLEWTNTGTMGGVFSIRGDPQVETVAGHQAVRLDGDDYLVGPATSAVLEGGGNPRTVEAWVYNPEVGTAETVVSWGYHASSGNRLFALRAGRNPSDGAVSFGDLGQGWQERLHAGKWLHLVSTLDRDRRHRLYLQGQLALEADLCHLDLTTHGGLPVLVGAEHSSADGSSVGSAASLSIGAIRVHAGVLSEQEIRDTFRQAASDYGIMLDEPSPDALDNDWELLNFGDLGALPHDDPDNDSLLNERELELRTNPLLADTDQDGFLDGDETEKHSDPTDPDQVPIPNAWKIADFGRAQQSLLKFSQTLNEAQVAAARSEGWRLSVHCRLTKAVGDSPSVGFRFADGVIQADVSLGFDATGSLVAFLGGTGDAPFSLALDPLSSREYHHHEIVFNPTQDAGSALVYSLDGSVIHSWGGIVSGQDSGQICWGALSEQGEGEAHFHEVALTTGLDTAAAAYSAGYNPAAGEPRDPYHSGWQRSGLGREIREERVVRDAIQDSSECRTLLALGTRPGALHWPYDLALDANGRLIVADYGNARVPVFSLSGEYLYELARRGNFDGEFTLVSQVAVNASGDRIVLDSDHDRVLVYSETDHLIRSIGGFGSGTGRLNAPFGLSVTADGRILVGDSGNDRVQVFDPAGNVVLQFGSFGTGDGQFGNVADVVESPTGDYFVSDRGGNQIHVFDATGNFLRKFGQTGQGPGEFDHPSGLHIDSQMRLFVADAGNNRIQILDLQGAAIDTIGSFGSEPGQFNQPRGVLVDATGNVWVADTRNNRVQQFDPQFQFVQAFGQVSEPSEVVERPAYVAFDESGHVLVTDSRRHEVKVFDSHGRFLRQFGQEGSAPGELLRPRGIAIDRNQQILIADNGNNRIQRFDVLGNHISTLGALGSGEGQFSGPHDVAVSGKGIIAVADLFNRRVQLFDQQEQFLRTLEDASDSGDRLVQPVGLAFDQEENLYVADTTGHRIVVYGANGEWVRNIGSVGSENTQLGFPRDVVVDRQGRILVSDSWNDRVQVFSQSGRFLRHIGEDRFHEISGIALSRWGDLAVCDSSYSQVYLWQNCLCFDSLGDINCDSWIDILDLVDAQPRRNQRARTGTRERLVDLDESGLINRSDLDLLINKILLEP